MPARPLFSEDNRSILDALDRAQLIAFAPYVWEASRLLNDKGILKCIEEAKEEGLTIEEAALRTGTPYYGARILMEAGLGLSLLYKKGERFLLAKTGHLLLNHEMTRVNFDFMRDVCEAGASSLEASIETGRPQGLAAFGNWATVYEGLGQLPEQARKSWLAFDHFYSDRAFPMVLPIVFSNRPGRILDIGGNTGKWTLACLRHCEDVAMGMVDLPGQIQMAARTIREAGFEGRTSFYDIDMLDPDSQLPKGYDTIWMSQFLDCFADEEIVSILMKCKAASDSHTRIFINETFWDRQRFETSAFALQMTSFYFTTMANGNSQMYDSQVFCGLIEKAGLEIVQEHDQIGLGHTLLELRIKP